MTELNLNMNRYRECARHVWNTYFRGQSNSEDLFLNVEYELFYALVLAPSGLEGEHKSPFDVPLPFLRVVPNPSLRVLSVMIAPPGGPDSNVYWKEVELEPGDLELRFIDFFDWANPDDFRDYQYVRARIVASHVGMEEFAYSYDSVGNRVSSERGAAVTTYGANSLNQYTVISNTVAMKAAYDADGNMVDAGNGWHYVWNAENRMILASNAEHVVTYAYDHRGRMVFKSVDAAPTRYLWDEYNIVAEMSKSGTVHNVWGLGLDGTLRRTGGVGGLLAVRRGETLFLPAYDANGSVTEYVSALDGVVSAHYGYSAFGEEIAASGELAEKFSHRFSTRPWCPVSQMSEYPLRKYNPILGRWCSRDSLEEKGSVLLYGFVYNSPLLLIDPLGQEAVCASILLGATAPVWGPWVVVGTVVVGASIVVISERYGVIDEIWELFTSVCSTCLSTGVETRTKEVKETKREKKKSRWVCQAQCNVQAIGNASCPQRVTGTGGGEAENSACTDAKRSATQSTPRGCYPRHCRCVMCIKR